MSHAHAQLRLARTHERIEIEIDFPVRGVGQAGLAPPNLRYIASLLLIAVSYTHLTLPTKA